MAELPKIYIGVLGFFLGMKGGDQLFSPGDSNFQRIFNRQIGD
jgi:hypothetical protein